MNTNEPTTCEIVRALRGGGIYGITTALELKIIDRLESQERELSVLRDVSAMQDDRLVKQDEQIMRFHELVCKKDNEIDEIREENEYIRDASNVLHGANEEKYRELVRITDELKAMTARAESAERERDAAIADFKVAEEDGLCCICAFIGNDIGQTKCMEDCCFKWRGQPQDGDGK